MLTDFQRNVLDYIATSTLQIQQRFHAGERIVEELSVVGAYAWALHADLTKSGMQLQFSDSMLTNRRAEPSQPIFFDDIHALEDFIGLVSHNAT